MLIIYLFIKLLILKNLIFIIGKTVHGKPEFQGLEQRNELGDAYTKDEGPDHWQRKPKVA